MPVLLTLTDDTSTNIRRRGLLVLTDFLGKFPDMMLYQTGLGRVFEDTIFPTLTYLPSLTPEEESVQLLVPAFAALRCLASKPNGVDPSRGVTLPRKQDYRLLDKILREGVLMAFFHAKEYVGVVEVLCQQTSLVLAQMGIHSVKHLKVNHIPDPHPLTVVNIAEYRI